MTIYLLCKAEDLPHCDTKAPDVGHCAELFLLYKDHNSEDWTLSSLSLTYSLRGTPEHSHGRLLLVHTDLIVHRQAEVSDLGLVMD